MSEFLLVLAFFFVPGIRFYRGHRMFLITKEIRFEAAHRLVKGYTGKCAHVHGHSWVVKITLGASELDAVDMVQDFGSLKPFREWVDESLDHATLVCQDDSSLLSFLRENGQRTFVFSSNPTSEAMAQMLFSKLLGMGFGRVQKVEVYETCTSAASYSK